MSKHQWIQISVSIIGALITLLILPLIRSISKLRYNEIVHLSNDISGIKGDIKDVSKKLDDHIKWHLNGEHKNK